MRTELKTYLPDENYKLLTYIVRFLEEVKGLLLSSLTVSGYSKSVYAVKGGIGAQKSVQKLTGVGALLKNIGTLIQFSYPDYLRCDFLYQIVIISDFFGYVLTFSTFEHN